MALYQDLANQLISLMKQDVYRPGEKLPSIRKLSAQHGVSVATSQKAYEYLEDLRLVEARAKSGYYVKLAPQPQEDITPLVGPMMPEKVSVHDIATDIFSRCESDTIVNLGTAYPDAHYLPIKALQTISRHIIKHRMKDVVETHFSPGDPDLLHGLAQRMAESGCSVSASDILVTNGCQEALSLCLRAVANPGDTIAIESPAFIGLLQLIEALGLKALEIPCHPTMGLSIEALELALEQWPIKAVAVVSSFSNPSGATMPEERRQALVELLATKDVPLIEDDLFGDISFDGSVLKPCKHWDKTDNVLYCSSISKTLSPGFRMGWLVPGRHFKEVEFLKAYTNVSVPMYSQLVVAEFLRTGKYDRHLRQIRTQFAQQIHKIQRLVTQYFPQGATVARPEGGYILWVKLPTNVDGFTLHLKGIEAGVGIVPGELFSASQKFKNYIRINCACDPTIDLEACISTLARLTIQLSSTDQA